MSKNIIIQDENEQYMEQEIQNILSNITETEYKSFDEIEELKNLVIDKVYSDFMNYEASATVADTGTVVSPMIDLSSASTSAELSFWMHAYGSTIGTFTVGVGNSASGPFTTEFTWTGELQQTAESEWANVGVDLTSYIGDTIYLAFTQTDGDEYYGDLSIDEITVTSCVACASPTSLAATATSGEVTPEPKSSYSPTILTIAVLPLPFGVPINASLYFLCPLSFNSYNS